jgi:hypothetical protein
MTSASEPNAPLSAPGPTEPATNRTPGLFHSSLAEGSSDQQTVTRSYPLTLFAEVGVSARTRAGGEADPTPLSGSWRESVRLGPSLTARLTRRLGRGQPNG